MTRCLGLISTYAAHCHNGDDGNLWFDEVGAVVSVPSLRLRHWENNYPEQDIATFDGHRDEYLPFHERITPQPVPTIPIAHQPDPAVSYLEAY